MYCNPDITLPLSLRASDVTFLECGIARVTAFAGNVVDSRHQISFMYGLPPIMICRNCSAFFLLGPGLTFFGSLLKSDGGLAIGIVNVSVGGNYAS